MISFMLSYFSYVLCPQLLSLGSTDVPAFLAKLTRAREAIIAVEAARAAAVLAVETSTQEATTVWDSTTLAERGR
jgi:hypothetical protein